MARLIDDDALKTKVILYANEPVKLKDRRWDTRCSAIIADMIGMIDKAPTVDAIPVEWLEARIKYAKETGIREAQEAFEFVLYCWKGVE